MLGISGNWARIGGALSASVMSRETYFSSSHAEGNTAEEFGGGLACLGELCVVEESNFLNNTTPGCGGGVYSDQAELNITDSAFQGNGAGDKGGGLFAAASPPQSLFTSLLFVNNSAEASGGAVAFGGAGAFVRCSFANNTSANGTGGALFLFHGGADDVMSEEAARAFWSIGGDGPDPRGTPGDSAGPTFAHCLFQNNTARHGGAVFARSGSVGFEACHFEGNNATEFGPVFAEQDTASISPLSVVTSAEELAFNLPAANLSDCRSGAELVYCDISKALFWTSSGQEREHLLSPPPPVDEYAEGEEEEDYGY
jgi:predicted outer membrane repeat protein